MTLDEIRALIQGDLDAVNAVVRARLKSSVALVDQVAAHIITGGGKRLRPLLVVLAGKGLREDLGGTYRGRGVHRVHPHGHPVARRCGRQLLQAPWPRDGK